MKPKHEPGPPMDLANMRAQASTTSLRSATTMRGGTKPSSTYPTIRVTRRSRGSNPRSNAASAAVVAGGSTFGLIGRKRQARGTIGPGGQRCPVASDAPLARQLPRQASRHC